jgi:hypothetical protein
VNVEIETTRQDLTESERERASTYLDETRNALLREIDGLSEARWTFKPALDRWSIAEILEHLAIVGNRVEDTLAQLPQAPAPPAGYDPKITDETVVKATAEPTTKFQAPSVISPSGRLTPASALDHFITSCGSIDATLQSGSHLRGHVLSHPVVGPLDGYQWILLVAAHIARHTKQVRDVKTAPSFPTH